MDTVISDRPARIQDFTDHACWYNSMAIDMLGIRDGSGQVGSPAGEATFIQDENGEPTGWALEAGPDSDYGIYQALGWQPPMGTEEESVKPFLDSLKDKGIIGLMDGFTEGEAAMKLFHDLDEKGELNMYYEGASLMKNYQYSEAYRANPYFGIQTSMTRVDIKYPLDPDQYPGSVRPPADAKLTLEQLLRGYTTNNAYRMRLQERTGSIEAGKMANLVVLDQDIFQLPAERVHEIDPEAVMFEGQWIKGVG